MCQRTPFHAPLVLLLNVLFVSSVAAQGVTGMVKGQIVDAAGVGVSGMTVALSDTSKGLARSVTTNASGRFQLRLAPGIYVLETSGTGYTAITGKQVSINLGSITELTISVISTIDEITVIAPPTELMATATGETSLHISLEDLAQLPVPRNIESVALLAPGTVAGIEPFGDDKSLVSFGGSSVAENIYYSDGLNVTNFRNGLGGSSVPFEFYNEFQIKTGGYSAEFGRSTGGVINSVTKRGDNEYEFGMVTYYEPESFRGTSPNTMRPDGSYYDLNSENSASSLTTDLYVSGPVIKDRLFFFVLYEPQSSSAKYNEHRSADRLWKENIDDDFWGGNLTWNFTDNHSLSYTTFTDTRAIAKDLFEYDVENKTTGDQVGDSTGHRGGDNYIVNYEAQLTDDLVVSALYGENEYNLTDRASTDEDCPRVVDASDSSTSLRPGCEVSNFIGTDRDQREAFRLDLSYQLGSHTLRAGFDREENLSFQARTSPGLSVTPDLAGGAFYRYESWNVGTQLPNGAIVPDVNGDGSRVDTVRFRYQSIEGEFDTISSAWYVEDTWEINDAFTLSLGIRNETFENYNGAGDLFFDIDNQWAPRLALSWSPEGPRGQRVTLNWGRYHLPIMALPNVQTGGAETAYDRYFVYDDNRDARTAMPIAVGEDGIPTTQELGSVRTLGVGSVSDARSGLDTSLKPMYQDEWIIAYERDFGEDWVAGVRYVKRELQSLIEDVALIAWFGDDFWSPSLQCWYVMTNPGSDMTTFCDSDGDGVLEEIFIPAEGLGYPKARRTYEAVEFTVEKSFGNDWSLQGSYTWSKNKGNTEGSVKSDNADDFANLTEDFDLPQLMDGASGYLPNDRRHKLKLWGSYQVTDHLMLGANLFAQSGRPINSFGIGHPDGTPWYGGTYYLTTDYGDPFVEGDETFEYTPRGSAGRTDWMIQFDLAAIYSFNWGDYAEVELRADVFNLLDADGTTEVYEYAEVRPDEYKLPTTYQQPRYLRFGAAIRF